MKGRCVLQPVKKLLEGVASGEISVDEAITRLCAEPCLLALIRAFTKHLTCEVALCNEKEAREALSWGDMGGPPPAFFRCTMKPAEACAPREYINPAHPGRFASSEPTAGSGIKIMMGHFCDLPLPGLFGTKIYDLFISATLTLTGENAKEAHG